MTTSTESVASFVRVEKGHADAEEVAAITAILLARAATDPAHGMSTLQTRSTAGWRRLERARGFRAPHSWQG
ncbi:acyl-CoA carboxylase subunit epsilon [Streptomyces sp.]|uniref:acyl-CoA carboxylase subunit epsilon n=1 Tax=Streptomyces sp. TaxID=1931 RepID=UPI002F42AE18